MFNFLVSASEGAWESSGCAFPRGRFLEYTDEEIAEKFRALGPMQLAALQRLPCLFAYEGTSEPMRIGRLSFLTVLDKRSSLYFVPEIDQRIPPIPFEKIATLQSRLDIRDWELHRTHWAIKDADLFEILGSEIDIPAPAKSTTVFKSDLPPSELPEDRADSVGSLVEIVLRLEHSGKDVFYRGHSNRVKYRLEPSILRKDERGNFIYRDVEDRLYRELLVSNSSDFESDVYTLDRLVRMQHYSMPTRLLDITSNPLIALYFACRSNAGQDGEVVVLSMDAGRIKYFDSDTASCIANLTRLPQSSKDKIDFGKGEVREFNDQEEVKKLLHFVMEEKPFFEGRIQPDHLRSVICVKGKHTNSRISFQSGAFLLFGHDAVLSEDGNADITIRRIRITDKERIMRQLDQLNINERTVFPYIESSARYIAEKLKFKEPNDR